MNSGFIQNLHLAIGFGVILGYQEFLWGHSRPLNLRSTSLLGQSFMRLVLRTRLTFLGFQSDALLRLRGFVQYFSWDKDCLRDRSSCKFKILASLLGCLSRWSRLVRFDEYKWFYFRHSLGFRDGMFHFGSSRFLAGLSYAQISAWREYARKLVA